ncbi:MAG: pyridoxal phosphate-dependent aminotransferase [Bacteroidota bacterium]|nr:pyridoxal phosphate-dependent aminotransferase [Candidatus Kapabacteria bacterium]MCS7303332.1 pyridoxal phosphate-dependent aminotransferase [Candidatus Kapabacteria bacterium]MCX7930350.1 pyridoxal phosphate-dependent aminotransferase [Chlorobiota bacterium]MDW8075685.1 pyridoxal phosphate-dependent aminotransferase [Bacteroidota bacterium]MDW8272258.1 pyridoxal phosphate-dependent aminotransferase [Bacteroidota bacterium]
MRRLSDRVTAASESQTLAIAARAKELARCGYDVISLAVGEPDFPTPPCVCQAAIRAIEEGKTRYTESSGIPELRRAVAEKFRRENHLPHATEETVLISCGAKHSIMNALHALCNPGDSVLIAAPYWVSYPAMAMLAGAQPRIVFTRAENGFKLTPEQLEQHLDDSVACVILNSPCNPTGAMYTRDEIADLVTVLATHDCYIISDEIYEKLTYTHEHVSIGAFDAVAERTITVNGCSKAYAMTGWRIGFMTGPRELIVQAAKVQSQDTSNPTSIAQYAALAALSCAEQDVARMRERFAHRRQLLLDLLAAIPGVQAYPPDGAFYVWLDIRSVLPPTWNSHTFAEQLLEKQYVATVPGEAFGMAGFIRLSFATSEEQLHQAIERLNQFIATLLQVQ